VKNKITKEKILKGLKEFAITIGGGVLLLGAIIGFFILLFSWGTPPEDKMKYDTSVLSVCQAPELSTDFDLPLAKNAKIAVGIVGREEVHEWQVALPEERIPDDESGVDIVICVDEGIQVYKTCKYTGGTSYRIRRYNPLIFVFHKESGIAFNSASFQGDMPKFRDCPFSFNNSDNFSGNLPSEDFVDWVEANIP
jgi:hypothetical protein